MEIRSAREQLFPLIAVRTVEKIATARDVLGKMPSPVEAVRIVFLGGTGANRKNLEETECSLEKS